MSGNKQGPISQTRVDLADSCVTSPLLGIWNDDNNPLVTISAATSPGIAFDQASTNTADYAGVNLRELGGGVFTLDLRSADPGATPANGVLLVNAAKNENNYALSRANADGTFTILNHDNGTQAAAFEQDPIAFVYLPLAACDRSELVAAGRIGTDTTADVGRGPFTVTKGGAGQWFLAIAGHDHTTGTLLLSPEGNTEPTNNSDNIVSHQWDGANNRWIVESRDLPNAVLQDGAATENMFSFAFFQREPDPIPTAIFANAFPALDRDADDNGNGLTNFEDYAAGYHPAAPVDNDFIPFITGSEPLVTYTHSLRPGTLDVHVRYEMTSDMKTFVNMVEDVHFRAHEITPIAAGRELVTIELLLDRDLHPRLFFRRHYCLAAP